MRGERAAPGGDFAALLSLPPEKLRRHPRMLYVRRAGEAPARALGYAHGGGSQNYDDLAFRYESACPEQPYVTVETLAGLAEQERRRERLRPPDDLAELAAQHDYLTHRRLVPPDGRSRYGIERGLLYVMAEHDGEVLGRFPLGLPSRTLDALAEPADLRPQPADSVRPHVADSLWLPLDELIQGGRFPEMREVASRLAVGVPSGHHHVFVSHRWLSTAHPDPEGVQARIVAWHLFAALCEAVRVARRRGLHTPRRVARVLNAPVGAAGSALVESLLVGVLRTALDQAALDALAQEVDRVEADAIDQGAAHARDDAGLSRLHGLLGQLPGLRPLLARIRLWYDYSCVPQAPRTPEEDLRFRRTLRTLPLLQCAGRTLVVLDDVADYLGRAWCSLEAATALVNTVSGRPDVLPATESARRRNPVADADVLERLVLDRQLVIWRGLLDTEVFRLQSRDACLRRLGLSMADPADLPHIYDSMLSVAVPPGRRSRHSLVTGVFPLPAMGGGDILIPSPDYAGNLPVDSEPRTRTIGSLDWWGALDLRSFAPEGHGDGRAPDTPSYWHLPARPDRRPVCHVAVVAECEGEAVLISSWVRRRCEELENLLRVRVGSGSWTSVDPVPVGHRVDGRLGVRCVDADVWVLVGKSGPVANEVGQALCKLLGEARVPAVTVSLDRYAENVSQIVGDVAPGEPPCPVLTGWEKVPGHPAGLLYMHLYRHLLQPEAPVE
ncbi:hypothetical protein [Streptomyces sp. NPDC050485]|uniref:hypothetical protein n=1 Tax=Streptomyces sp. NPDC050485 TaxID=3365617 RepID=UPI0037A8B2CD